MERVSAGVAAFRRVASYVTSRSGGSQLEAKLFLDYEEWEFGGWLRTLDLPVTSREYEEYQYVLKLRHEVCECAAQVLLVAKDSEHIRQMTDVQSKFHAYSDKLIAAVSDMTYGELSATGR